MPDSSTNSEDSVSAAGRVVIGICVLLAAVGLAVSLLPFNLVRPRLNAWAGDGSADLYTPAVHARFRVAGGVLGGLGLLTTALVVHYRGRVTVGWQSLRQRGHHDARRLSRDMAALIRDRWVWLTITTLLAMAVRIHYLDEPMRYDESHTFIKYASMPAPLIVTRYDEPNNHILHTLSVRATTQVFGRDPWAVRLTSLLCGILLAPITLCWGTVAGGRTVGVIAGLLMAVHSNAVEFSVNARGYTLASLLFCIACFSGGYALRRNNVAAWAVMVAAMTLSLWTVPTMFYAAVALFVWLRVELFATRHRDGHWRRWVSLLMAFLMTGVFTIICYLPVLLAVGLSEWIRIASGTPVPWSAYFERLPATFTGTCGWAMRDVPWGLQAVLCLCAVIALMAAPPVRRRRLWQGVAAAVTVVAVMTLQRALPPERTWLFAVPPLLILCATGISMVTRRLESRRRKRRVGQGVAVVLAMVMAGTLLSRDSIRTSDQTGTFRDAEEVVVFLETVIGEREPVITVTPASAPVVFYARRRGLPESHFLMPGQGLIDDTSALVVTDRRGAQTPRDVVRELGLHALFAAESAMVVAEFPTAIVYRVSQR